MIAKLHARKWLSIQENHYRAMVDHLLILLLAVLPFWAIPWKGGIVNVDDFHHPWFPWTALRQWFYTWLEMNNGTTNIAIYPSNVILNGIAVALDAIGVSQSVANRLLWVLPLFLLGVSARHSCHTMLSGRWVRSKGLIAAFLIIYSPPTIALMSFGQPVLAILPGAFGILSLSYFVRGAKSQRLDQICLSAVMTLVASMLIQQMVLAFGAMLVYVLVDGLRTGRIASNLRLFSVVVLLFALLNAWWLLPFVREALGDTFGYYSGIDPNEAVSYAATFNSMLRTILMRNTAPAAPLGDRWASPVVLTFSVFLAILCLMPLLRVRNRRDNPILWLYVFLILLLLLAVGGKRPIGSVYLFLIRNISSFAMFRGLEKFSTFMAFCFAVLGAMSWAGVRELIECRTNAALRRVTIISFSTLLVGATILSSPALITGDLGGVLRSYELPAYYSDARSFLMRIQGSYNVFALPFSQFMSKFAWTPNEWNHMENPVQKTVFEQPVIFAEIENQTLLNSPTQAVWGTILERPSGSSSLNALSVLLKIINARYVLVQNDKFTGLAAFADDVLAKLQQPLLKKIREDLGSIAGIRLVKQFGFLDIYEVDGTESTSVVASNAVTIVGDGSPVDVVHLARTPYIGVSSSVFAPQQIRAVSGGADAFSQMLRQTQGVVFYGRNIGDLVLDLLEPRWKNRQMSNDQSSFVVSIQQKATYAVFARSPTGDSYSPIPFVRLPGKEIVSLTATLDSASVKLPDPTSFFVQHSPTDWHYLGDVVLNPGEHKLVLRGDKAEEIILVPLTVLDATTNKVLDALENPDNRIAYLFDSDERQQTAPKATDTVGRILAGMDRVFQIDQNIMAAQRVDVRLPLTNTFYVPNKGSYYLKALVAPRSSDCKTPLLPEPINWRHELANWEQVGGKATVIEGQAWDNQHWEPPLVFYGDGWYAKESDYRSRWRWGINKLQLLVLNPNSQSLQGELSLRITTIVDRDLEVVFNGQPARSLHLSANYDQVAHPPVGFLRRLAVGSSTDRQPPLYQAHYPPESTTVTFDHVSLHPGINEVLIYSRQGMNKMKDLLGVSESRDVSLQLWDDIKFDMQGTAQGDTGKTQETGDRIEDLRDQPGIVENQLVLNLPVDGAADEQKYLLIRRDFQPVDLKEYPSFKLHYIVSDPTAAAMDIAFGIDFTGDGHADGYVTAQATPTEDGRGQQVVLDLLAAAKGESSGSYDGGQRDPRLVSLYLIFHRQWRLDAQSAERNGIYTFRVTAWNLYSDDSVPIPDYTQSRNAQSSSDCKEVTYPADDPQSAVQRIAAAKLFDRSLVKLDDQPISMQPPADQANLLDEAGYWLEPVSMTLSAGFHRLEILTSTTFAVDSVELANKPYEAKPPAAQIHIRKANPTRYNVNVNAQDSFWLILNQSFHEDWRAYVVAGRSTGSPPWYDRSALLTWLMERKRRTKLKDHYVVNTYANGWYIPITGEYVVTLEYLPQRLLEIGSMVSSIVLLGCIGYILRRHADLIRDTAGKHDLRRKHGLHITF